MLIKISKISNTMEKLKFSKIVHEFHEEVNINNSSSGLSLCRVEFSPNSEEVVVNRHLLSPELLCRSEHPIVQRILLCRQKCFQEPKMTFSTNSPSSDPVDLYRILITKQCHDSGNPKYLTNSVKSRTNLYLGLQWY